MTIGERLDSLPLRPFHWKLAAASGLGWLFDAMDSGLVSFVLAVLAKEWALEARQIGWVGSVGMAGMFFGAIASGMLADRYGRKNLFMATLALFSVATGLCGLAGGLASLLVLRFWVGFGLGGELPVASALVSEFSPKSHRGKLVVFLESFWALGWAVAAVVAFLLIPRLDPSIGWRAAFFLGSLPALYTLYLRSSVPESPRFLANAGRWEEAKAVVRRVEEACGEPHAALEPSPAQAAGASVTQSFLALWLGESFKRTLMLWVLWFVMVYSYYGIFIWLPSILVAGGHTVVKTFGYVLIITAAQIPGYFSAALLVDRFGRKPVLIAYMLGCAASCWGFGSLAGTPASIMAWGSLISFFNLGAWGVVYTYTPEIYPTEVRATGCGWAVGFGRVGGILAPFVVGAIMGIKRPDLVFGHMAALVVLGLVVVALLGEETKGRSLA
ncbi:MAG: MFS transporter [Elusimicrobia bacterium]|nr:MFS transporter [Elusimicrobiota bacterium]